MPSLELLLTDRQVNTSMVGEFVLNQTSSSGSSLYSALAGDISQIQGTIQGDLNEQIHSFAQALGIHDFYSAYVLDYCEVRSWSEASRVEPVS